MVSLDVDALLTNIPLQETIDICVKKLCKTLDTLVKGISKNGFCDLLHLVTKESFFTFNSKLYIYSSRWCCYGVPSRFNIGNIFLSHHQESWLNKCPVKCKSSCFRRYVDDIYFYF